jgi:predicted dehydrogenase
MLCVSIIGLGMAAEPHALSLMDLRRDVQVRWAASPSAARTGAFAARYPFPITNDVDRAIADPQVDAVILLTPPNTHLELARKIFDHGKHLLIEKPLDVTLDRAQAIVEAAEKSDRRLGVVLQHRFRPGAERLSELLRQEALGAVQAATLNVPWWRAQSYYDEPGRGTRARDGGGVLMTQAIHSLDLFRVLLGPIVVEAATARTTALHKMETEDIVMALLRLGNGAPASLLATTASYPGHPEEIGVIGTLGSARLTGGRLEARWLDGRSEDVSASKASGAAGSAMDFPHDAHKALIADFCRAIAENRAPRTSGREALETQRLIADLLSKAKRE